jgi:diguanylate cyclase (GGDEF)-like protein
MKKSISTEVKKSPKESKTKALRQRDDIYRSMVEATSDSIYMVDRKCRIYVTTSVGIAMYPDHGDDLDTLIKKADQAMYEAKNTGRNRYCFYKNPS